VLSATLTRLDGPAAVETCSVNEPVPGPHEVLISVQAAGVAFPDLLQTRGEYQIRHELPFVLGGEVAGILISAPQGSGFHPGERVVAYCGHGGFAEQVAVDANMVFPLPENLDLAQGAALPMNLLTAHFALLRRGRLQPGETVLVHGSSGGVGLAAVQLAAARGAHVIAVASTEAKRAAAARAGAHVVLGVDGFLEASREATDGRGVDLVLDPVGGDRFTDSLRALASEGRVLVVGFAGGGIPTVRVNRLLLGNTAVIGAGWGALVTQQPGFAAAQWGDILPDLTAGRLTPVITGSYPLTAAGEAVAALALREVIGKLVITMPGYRPSHNR
jgi:NADPH2:quinone reductase